MLKKEINEIISKGNKSEYRKFGLTMGIVLGLISAILFWKTRASAPYFSGIGLLFILTGLLIPQILKPVYKIWMGFAVVMGYFMSRVILSLMFFIMFAPVGLITRLLGKDLLKERWDKNAESYWIKRIRKPYDPQSAEHQF